MFTSFTTVLLGTGRNSRNNQHFEILGAQLVQYWLIAHWLCLLALEHCKLHLTISTDWQVTTFHCGSNFHLLSTSSYGRANNLNHSIASTAACASSLPLVHQDHGRRTKGTFRIASTPPRRALAEHPCVHEQQRSKGSELDLTLGTSPCGSTTMAECRFGGLPHVVQLKGV